VALSNDRSCGLLPSKGKNYWVKYGARGGVDATGSNLRQSNYVADGLNQLSQRTVPGAIDIVGTSDAAATVTVNNQATYRRGSYFQTALSFDNSMGR
jgi:hypothetical protein